MHALPAPSTARKNPPWVYHRIYFWWWKKCFCGFRRETIRKCACVYVLTKQRIYGWHSRIEKFSKTYLYVVWHALWQHLKRCLPSSVKSLFTFSWLLPCQKLCVLLSPQHNGETSVAFEHTVNRAQCTLERTTSWSRGFGEILFFVHDDPRYALVRVLRLRVAQRFRHRLKRNQIRCISSATNANSFFNWLSSQKEKIRPLHGHCAQTESLYNEWRRIMLYLPENIGVGKDTCRYVCKIGRQPVVAYALASSSQLHLIWQALEIKEIIQKLPPVILLC